MWLNALWADLAQPDAAQAYKAMATLADHADEAAPFLGFVLRKEPSADARLVNRLISELDDDSFIVREKASQELANLGDLAEPAIRRAWEGKTSAEVRFRLKALLNKLGDKAFDRQRNRILRAVEVLERMGTAKAREVLQALQTGATGPLADEAKASLERLARRPVATR